MRIDAEFPSLWATLRGWLYQPDLPLAPAIVMAHGFSATGSMTIDKYAEAFYAAGFAVLLFDHRGFGASDGNPPRQVNPWVQTRGYLDAVAFLSKLDGVDPDRIAVWGDSLSAGVACVAKGRTLAVYGEDEPALRRVNRGRIGCWKVLAKRSSFGGLTCVPAI
jgi:pimeloyl-ACP methyl ester carboxylesterase